MFKKFCCMFLVVVMLLPIARVSAEDGNGINDREARHTDEDGLLPDYSVLAKEDDSFKLPKDEETLEYCEDFSANLGELTIGNSTAEPMMLPFTDSIREGIKSFQQYINTNLPMSYLGKTLRTTGTVDEATKTAAIKLIQYRLNQLGAGLAVDGGFGPASQAAFSKYVGTIKRYNSGVWVYILQGLLYCHLYDPNGFDGSYGVNGGTGCLNAVNLFKKRNLITEGGSGVVGINTMLCLTWRTVENTFDDGVYYISSVLGNVLHVSNGEFDNFTEIKVFTKYGSDTHEVITLRQLWKITYLGQGYYSIRPMNKLDMALTVSGTEVVIRYAGESDHFNTLSNDFKWTITENTLGLVLKNYNDNSRVLSVVNDSTSSGSYTCIRESTSSKQKWQLSRLSSPPSGAFLYDKANGHISFSATRYMSLNQSKKLSDFDLVAIRYSVDTNSQELSWQSSDVRRKPFGWAKSQNVQIDTYAPNIEAVRGTDGQNNFVQITIITSDIEEGAYRIRNRSSGKYVDIFEQRITAGTNIHQWERHNGETQIWYFNINSRDGYYTISNIYHSAGGAMYCLGVQGNSTSDDTQIVLANPYGTEDTKWKVLGSYAGSYVIRPKTSIDTMALAAERWSSADGVLLKQKIYTKDQNFYDEWYLERTGGTLGVISYYDLGFDVRYTDDFGESPLKIARVQNMVSQKLKSFFNLSVVPLYIPYRSKADECKIDKDSMGRVTEENINNPCEHLFECLTWEAQRSKLKYAYGMGTDKIARVLWTGHRMKNNASSVTDLDDNMCMITLANTIQTDGTPYSGLALENHFFGDLLHELSHLLGAPDHYCYGREGKAHCSNPNCDECAGKTLRKCIMSVYKSGMENASTASQLYCGECNGTIQNHINNHHR